jgi:hypothetical protein
MEVEMEILFVFLLVTIVGMFVKTSNLNYRLDREIARSAKNNDQLEFIVSNNVFLAGESVQEDVIHDLILRFVETETGFVFQIWNMTTNELVKEFDRFDHKVYDFWLFYTDKNRAAEIKYFQEMQRIEKQTEKQKQETLDRIRKDYGV